MVLASAAKLRLQYKGGTKSALYLASTSVEAVVRYVLT